MFVVELMKFDFQFIDYLLGNVMSLSSSVLWYELDTLWSVLLLFVRFSAKVRVPRRIMSLFIIIVVLVVTKDIIVVIFTTNAKNIHVDMSVVSTNKNLICLWVQWSEHGGTLLRMMIVLRWNGCLIMWERRVVGRLIRFLSLKVLLLSSFRTLVVINAENPLATFHVTLSCQYDASRLFYWLLLWFEFVHQCTEHTFWFFLFVITIILLLFINLPHNHGFRDVFTILQLLFFDSLLIHLKVFLLHWFFALYQLKWKWMGGNEWKVWLLGTNW